MDATDFPRRPVRKGNRGLFEAKVGPKLFILSDDTSPQSSLPMTRIHLEAVEGQLPMIMLRVLPSTD